MKILTASACMALFILSGFIVTEKTGTDESGKRLTMLLQQNGGPVDFIMVGEVLAEFEFYLTAAKAPLDKYAMGNKNALSESEKRGTNIFFTKGKCVSCHAVSGNSNQMFSDFNSHNAGVPQIHPVLGTGTANVPFSELECPNKMVTGRLDYGLEEFTGNMNDRYLFYSDHK